MHTGGFLGGTVGKNPPLHTGDMVWIPGLEDPTCHGAVKPVLPETRHRKKNLWSMPHDVSHTEADDDRILYNLIVVRNQQAKDSEVVWHSGQSFALGGDQGQTGTGSGC